MKYRHHIWRCNNKYEQAKRCTSATLRKEAIHETYAQAITALTGSLGTLSHLKQAINTAFDTTALQERLTQVEATLTELQNQFTSLITQNQTTEQNQTVKTLANRGR